MAMGWEADPRIPSFLWCVLGQPVIHVSRVFIVCSFQCSYRSPLCSGFMLKILMMNQTAIVPFLMDLIGRVRINKNIGESVLGGNNGMCKGLEVSVQVTHLKT